MNKYVNETYKNATETISKTRQIVLLYEAAIRYIRQAEEAINEKRIEDKYNLLVKAGNIIEGLHGCLDHEKGGDVAKVLDNFYSSMSFRIIDANTKGDVKACQQIVEELKTMRQAWDEIDQEMSGAPEDAKPADKAGNITA